MMRTPGKTGSVGKCPWNIASFIETFLMPTQPLSATAFSTRSIIRNG
jgi:hypothetical protein